MSPSNVKKLRLWIFMTVLTLCALLGVSEATVVYDNTTTPLSAFELAVTSTGINTTVGDEITLSGTERLVTGFSIILFASADSAGTMDVQISFLNNDGTGGAPGTQISQWTLDNAPFGAFGNDTYTLSVPLVLVPDTFTWAVTLSDVVLGSGSNYLIGPRLYDPPTVGSSGDFDWHNSTGTWNMSNSAGFVDNLGFRLNAIAPIPEPSTFLLLGAGLAGLGLLRRKLRK